MEQIYSIGAAADAQKVRLARYAEKLGWKNPALAAANGRVARCANCQAPDFRLYNANFKARRAAR